MSEILSVFRREFLERVRSKAFLLGTLLFPVLMGALFIIPARMGTGGGTRHLVVVDQAPAGVGETVIQLLTARPTGPASDRVTFTAERVARPLDQVKAELIGRVQRKEIDGYLYLPPDIVQTSHAEYRARNVANFTVLKMVEGAATQAVQAARLRAAGLDGARVAALVREVDVGTARITDKGEEGGSAASTFFLGYVVGFLAYMMILIYGMNVLRSVLEEKTNKIAEVIVSSMKASHLMLGKILGVGAVALLQVGTWAAITALMVSRSDTLSRRFHLPPGMFDVVHVPPATVAALLAFFVLGFFLYAALYAALGAAVNSEQEAQQFQLIVMMPLIVPMVMVVRIVSDPLGPVATTLGMIPFTAPVTMAMRLASTPVPPVQVIGSLALLVATVLAVAWVAGKIYRVGILSTGKKPTLPELWLWLWMA